MKKLFLLRHAQTEGYSISIPDSKRKLTEIGIKDAMRLGEILQEENYKEGNYKIDKIITSIAVRAQTTARCIAEGINYPLSEIQAEDDLYECSELDLFRFITQLEDNSIQNLLLVNHNPAASLLIYLLSEKDYGFLSPCSLVVFSFDVENWKDITKGSAKVEEIRIPERNFEVE